MLKKNGWYKKKSQSLGVKLPVGGLLGVGASVNVYG